MFLVKGVAKNSEGISNVESKSRKMESTSAKESYMVDPNKPIEWIQIPKFSADNMKFLTWWAAFSSCVDETSLSPQFKMLRLEETGDRFRHTLMS